MISCDNKISRLYCLHYWFDDEGNGSYHTWDYIERVKLKLEKEHKWQNFKKIIKFSIIPIFIVYAIILNVIIIKFPILQPYYGLAIIPVGGTLPWFFMSIQEPSTSLEHHKYKLRRFKELYNDEFDLTQGFWGKVKINDDTVTGNGLDILERISQIQMKNW